MDHRVSKDMISSGMTPSGEKSQADLGKTQYGSAPSPNRLMDAYQSMYQDQKEETLNEKMGDMADFASRNIKGARGAAVGPETGMRPARGATQAKPNSDSMSQTSGIINKVRARRGKLEDKEGITARREKVQGIMNKAREQGLTDGVDLLAAYQSIYADTFEEGKIPAGLQAYLDKKKGKKKDDDNGDEEKEGKKKDKKDMKEAAGLYANIHAKRKRGGKMRKKGAKGAPSSQDFANAARTAKEDFDVFDTILNHCVNEGYDAEDVIQVMSSLTEEQLSEEPITATLLALGKVAGIAAKKGIASMAAKGAGKAGLKATATAFKNPTAGNIGKVAGQVAKGASKNPLRSAADLSYASNIVPGGGGGGQKPETRRTGTVSASADLFDIVKGQLIDEGLSEEEIRDIMTTLTPEEIMNEMAVNPKIAAMDAKNKADMIARAQANKVPDKIREASKRQMKAGTPREDPKNPYTTQDKKDIINYNKDK